MATVCKPCFYKSPCDGYISFGAVVVLVVTVAYICMNRDSVFSLDELDGLWKNMQIDGKGKNDLMR